VRKAIAKILTKWTVKQVLSMLTQVGYSYRVWCEFAEEVLRLVEAHNKGVCGCEFCVFHFPAVQA